jgi:hypothetical protein
MTTHTGCGLASAAMALILVGASASSAQLADRRAYFTFNTPVEVPGVALPPGKYLFRVANPEGTIVQVLSADGTKVFSTAFSIPAIRPAPAEVPEVRLIEAPAGVPPAVKTWWYPGESTGREFIYPRTQALRLAHAATEPVLTTQGESASASQTNTKDLTRVSANGQETQVNPGTTSAPAAPRGQAVQGEAAPSSVTIPSGGGPGGR